MKSRQKKVHVPPPHLKGRQDEAKVTPVNPFSALFRFTHTVITCRLSQRLKRTVLKWQVRIHYMQFYNRDGVEEMEIAYIYNGKKHLEVLEDTRLGIPHSCRGVDRGAPAWPPTIIEKVSR
jgi:hypothetical protein